MTFARRLIPYSVLPLSLIACALASSPWLRAYPASTLAVPLFGTALLSVLIPIVVVGIGLRSLALTVVVDAVAFAFFTMLVALREPTGLHDLWTGLVHAPSEVLTFALPLVTPRTLLVPPIALCWICGAIIGECLARGWRSVVPYATLLLTFGLSYGGSVRAISSSADGRRYDTILAGALLLTLLLLRAAQAWVAQDEAAEASDPEGVLPLRGVAVGALVSLVIAALAAVLVQSDVFRGPPSSPARRAPVALGRPVGPLAFISQLRPLDPRKPGKALFTVTVDRTTSNYIAIATTDTYNGDSWSFDNRNFRPSGGVIPADSDPQMRPPNGSVEQVYKIDDRALSRSPWMPYQNRPRQVTGRSVDVDVASGMIVPSHPLHAGDTYSVTSTTTRTTLDQLPDTVLPATSAPAADTGLAGGLVAALGPVIEALRNETGTEPTNPITFVQAVAADLRSNYALTNGARPTPVQTPTAPATTATTTAPTSSAPRSPSGSRTPSRSAGARFGAGFEIPPRRTPSPTPATGAGGGGTSFANVLGAILGPTRSATPEQYATFLALVARSEHLPARLVTGFRIAPSRDGAGLARGTYTVTSGDAWTWVEIPIQGFGWVTIDPSPGKIAAATPPSASGTAGGGGTPTATQTPTGLVTSSAGGRAVAPPTTLRRTQSVPTASVVAAVVGSAVALVLLALAILLLRKALRVRRRRGWGDPRLRLLGAWQESLDVLAESGAPDLSALTSSEVGDVTDAQFGPDAGQHARRIGERANTAIFSPTSWIGADEADAAWQSHASLRRAIGARLTVRQRMGAGLRYHHAPRPGSQPTGPASWAAAMRGREEPLPQRRRRGRHGRRH